MIVITGAAGFIGSCLAISLNRGGCYDLVLVDDFTMEAKEPNLSSVKCAVKVDRIDYIEDPGKYPAEMIFHIGARTDTTEFDIAILDRLNLSYSKAIWAYATHSQIPLIYASSAATYGDGSLGFADAHEVIGKLKPLNPYGQSKGDFDLWVLGQKKTPPFWVGLKFFNVFGPNEYHKGRMASVVFHTFHQIAQTGAMRLFESHHSQFKDGEQSRDFIYIKDVLKVLHFWQIHQQNSGIYNLGTGISRSFLDLAKAVFKALKMEPKISFIPTPEDLRATYQYYTKADMTKTLNAGYGLGFMELEESVADYVKMYLNSTKNY